MKNDFRLTDFVNGAEAKTRDGVPVRFICLLPDIPAKLLVDVGGSMENYYLDGSIHNNSYEHKDDIVMNTYFDK